MSFWLLDGLEVHKTLHNKSKTSFFPKFFASSHVKKGGSKSKYELGGGFLRSRTFQKFISLSMAQRPSQTETRGVKYEWVYGQS